MWRKLCFDSASWSDSFVRPEVKGLSSCHDVKIIMMMTMMIMEMPKAFTLQLKALNKHDITQITCTGTE